MIETPCDDHCGYYENCSCNTWIVQHSLGHLIASYETNGTISNN